MNKPGRPRGRPGLFCACGYDDGGPLPRKRRFDPAGHVVVMADGAVRGVIPPDRSDSFGPPLPEEGLDPVGALMAFTGRTV